MAAATNTGTTRRSWKTTRSRKRASTNITGTLMGKVMGKVTITATIRNAAMKATTTAMRTAELTALLHLASPALPIGAFSYSQGLESAIEHGFIHDGDSARNWIASGLTNVLARGES